MEKIPPASETERRRSIRLFVSSTFRDMKGEREELVKRVFPQVRKLCEQRGVAWAEVDLRWGITDEQKSEGQVLSLCLSEIRNCQPFFLGILGERYGWIPGAFPPGVVEEHPWIAREAGRSVTELEIIHGVLRDPDAAGHASFYFRDPSYLDRLPLTAWRADYVSEGPASAERLARLKDRIRRSGLPVREGYRDPRELGELVLADLVATIDRLFPGGSEPGEFERERGDHEEYAQARALIYVARPSDFHALDRHADGEGPPLIVLGTSGSGKSALLANWALRRRAARPDELLVMHFAGASPLSTDPTAMIRRILVELKRHCKLDREVPDRPEQLQDEFADWMAAAGERARVVLVLDALNQLENRDGALDLAWLPRHPPANVRLVASALPGRALDELVRRGWPSLMVEPLTPGRREALIVGYLAYYSKSLSPRRVRAIVESGATSNPLYLRVLLEELRLFGEHERLDERLAHYLAAPDLVDLFGRILDRYQADYEGDRPGLVRDAFSLLWASRRGLTEAELLDLLGPRGEPMPRVYWTPLALASEASLVSRSGLLGFSHEFIREAVRRKYLPRTDLQRRAHRRLADDFARRGGIRSRWRARQVAALAAFLVLAALASWPLLALVLATAQGLGDKSGFERLLLVPPAVAAVVAGTAAAVTVMAGLSLGLRWAGGRIGYWAPRVRSRACRRFVAADPDGPGPRVVDELPWQLAGAGAWWRLHDLLGRLPFFRRAWAENPFQVRAYWRQVEAGTFGRVGRLFARTRELDRAYRAVVGGRALEAYRRVLVDPASHRDTIAPVAHLLTEMGHDRQASALVDRLIRVDDQGADRSVLTATLVLQAEGLRDARYSIATLAAYRRAERLARASGDLRSLCRCLEGQSALALERGEREDARGLAEQAERVGREAGEPTGLARALLSGARALRALCEADTALGRLDEAERLLRPGGNRAELIGVLRERQSLLQQLGDLEGSELDARRIGHFREELGDDEPEPPPDDLDARARALRRHEVAYRQSGERTLLAYTLIELAYHWAVLRRFPAAARPVAVAATRLAGRLRLGDLLAEFRPVQEATDDDVRQLAGGDAVVFDGARIRPLLTMVISGGLAALAFGLALGPNLDAARLGVAEFVASLAALGWGQGAGLLCGALLGAAALRGGHALMAGAYLILVPQGLAIRHWRLDTGAMTLGSLAHFVRPYWRVEHEAVAWSDFLGCRVERPGLRPVLVVDTASGPVAVGHVFHRRPGALRDRINAYFREVARDDPGAARGLEAPDATAPPTTSRLAVAGLSFGIASYVILPVVGGMLALILGRLARRAIRASGGRLLGMRMARWGEALGVANLLIATALIALGVALGGG